MIIILYQLLGNTVFFTWNLEYEIILNKKVSLHKVCEA